MAGAKRSKGGIRQRGDRLKTGKSGDLERFALYRAVTASSSVSAICSWRNSSAKPSSRFRTTRDCTLPSRTSDFTGGRFSAAIAARNLEEGFEIGRAHV